MYNSQITEDLLITFQPPESPKEREASFLCSICILSCLENNNYNLPLHTFVPSKKGRPPNGRQAIVKPFLGDHLSEASEIYLFTLLAIAHQQSISEKTERLFPVL